MEILHFEELSQPYSKSVASCVGLIIKLLAAGWVSSFLPEPVQGPKKNSGDQAYSCVCSVPKA